jgi:hypothetical protein
MKRPEIRVLTLSDSCNGLFLFKHGLKSGPSDRFGYIVCNPATKQWVIVPRYDAPPPVNARGERRYSLIRLSPLISTWSSSGSNLSGRTTTIQSSRRGPWTRMRLGSGISMGRGRRGRCLISIMSRMGRWTRKSCGSGISTGRELRGRYLILICLIVMCNQRSGCSAHRCTLTHLKQGCGVTSLAIGMNTRKMDGKDGDTRALFLARVLGMPLLMGCCIS